MVLQEVCGKTDEKTIPVVISNKSVFLSIPNNEHAQEETSIGVVWLILMVSFPKKESYIIPQCIYYEVDLIGCI